MTATRGALHCGHGGRVSAAFVMLLFASASTHGQEPEPYHYFGGDVDRLEKSPAVEACEYRVLVEMQYCNTSLNKTRCFERVREACLADPAFLIKSDKPGEPERS